MTQQPASRGVFSPPPVVCAVCERSGLWSATLRRLLDSERVELVELRSRQELAEWLVVQPGAAVVLELPADAAATLDELARLRREFPQTLWIVVAAGAERPWLELAGELGATCVVASLAYADLVAGALRQWAGKHVSSSQDGFEHIRANMPWQAVDAMRPLPIGKRSAPSGEPPEEPIEFEPLF